MEDINEIVSRVTQELDSDRRRMMIENYINLSVASIQSDTVSILLAMHADTQIAPEINTWMINNRAVVSYKIAEAARIILRQELLGE